MSRTTKRRVPATSTRRVAPTVGVLALVVALVLSAAPGVAAPSDPDLTVPGDHPSLSAAVNAAEEGDTILIDPGTYLEPVGLEITKSLTIRGTHRSHRPAIHIPDLALRGEGKTWTVENVELYVDAGLLVAGGTSDATRNHFTASNCRIETDMSPWTFALLLHDFTIIPNFYGDITVDGCELEGFFGGQLGGFSPWEISDFDSLRIRRSSFEGVFVGLNVANARYTEAPVIDHNALTGEIAMYMGRGVYDGAVIKGNDFTVADNGWTGTGGLFGLLLDEDHFGDNPDGRVFGCVIQGNRFEGAGLHAILVDDAEDNVFVGNSVRGFSPFAEHVLFLEEALGNFYVGNGNLVNDPFDQNTITGVDQVIHRPLTPGEQNTIAHAMRAMNDWR